MIVLFCTNTFESSENGPSKFARYVLELNNNRDTTIHVLTEDVSTPSINVYPVVVKNRLLSSQLGMILRNTDYHEAILQYIRSNGNPDIIIFNNAIVGVKSFRKINLPCIGMINDDSSINIKQLNLGWSKRFFRHKVFHSYELKACKYADGIIVNSKSLEQSVQKEYPEAHGKTHLLYKSTNTNIEGISNAFKCQRPLQILFVKSDWHRGGLNDLMLALSLINIKSELHIIGPKKKDINYLVSSNSNDLLLLKCHGPCPQKKVYNLMKKSDIFCTPSISEALGVANMEALILKLPVVYTDVGGIPEVMDYGNNGFKAAPNNPQSLANAILKCINNDEVRNQKVNNGYLFVQDKFNKKRMLDNFIKICKRVISS